MKILALSDIHNNVAAVRKLRHQENNIFDAVIVAGDIGSEAADENFEVLSTFKCKILYVYGNWDSTLKYDRTFGEYCIHLHTNMVEIDDIAITGFSGCDTKWGRNPIAMEL